VQDYVGLYGLVGSVKRGFSLLEVVVSISLVGLIVIFVLTLWPSSIVASQAADEQIEAESLAQSHLEESRAVPFSSLGIGTQQLSSPGDRYRVFREVFQPPGTDPDQTVGIRITVLWESKTRSREVVREMWLSSVRS